MLAQQSPRWVCRICLSAQPRRIQYRQLTQITTEQSDSTDPVIPPTPSLPDLLKETIVLKSAKLARRVPLSEIIAARAKKKEEKAQASNEEDSPVTDQAGSENAVEPKSKPSKTAKSKDEATKTESPTGKLMKVMRNKSKSKSESAPSESAPSSLVKSLRSNWLDANKTSFPAAPITHIRKTKVSRQSPLEQIRARVDELVSDPKFHPNDPLNSFLGFPGSATRDGTKVKASSAQTILEGLQKTWSEDIVMTPVQPKEFRPIPTLEHGLDRVLFNPGVMYLRDPRSHVYNFDPYLEKIMPKHEFDYDALYEYITSSRDTTLVDMAKEVGAKFVGSTSSMTAVLSHFHFLLSAWRPVNIDMLSSCYTTQYRSFTAISRAPAVIFLRYKGDGVYAIDADKMYDTRETVLSWLGRSMEKMLTLPPHQMEKFNKQRSHTLEPHERGQPEAYHYTLSDQMLMRSQLDCNDARLPGTGVFDLKTRACISVRMDVQNSEEGADYEIHHRTGVYNSFEREYYDMVRSAFLKYSLQVRIGHMDGIFVAYHNTKRIFGFQYISLEEMDTTLHGSGVDDIGRREFHFSIRLLNEALEKAVEKFPEQSLRLTFETRDTKIPSMYIFAEPFEEAEIDAIQTGEYIQAVRMAEERARAEAEEKSMKLPDPVVEAGISSSDTEVPSESETNAEMESESSTFENESDEEPSSSSLSEETDEFGVVTDDKTPPRPLLAMCLKAQNFINGNRVDGPPTPTAADRWEITYTLENFDETRGTRLHKMSQDRRRKAFDDEFREQALEGKESAEKTKEWNRAFLMHLKELSQRGKIWREGFEKTVEDKEKVVWKEGPPPSKHGMMAWREQQKQHQKQQEHNEEQRQQHDKQQEN